MSEFRKTYRMLMNFRLRSGGTPSPPRSEDKIHETTPHGVNSPVRINTAILSVGGGVGVSGSSNEPTRAANRKIVETGIPPVGPPRYMEETTPQVAGQADIIMARGLSSRIYSLEMLVVAQERHHNNHLRKLAGQY